MIAIQKVKLQIHLRSIHIGKLFSDLLAWPNSLVSSLDAVHLWSLNVHSNFFLNWKTNKAIRILVGWLRFWRCAVTNIYLWNCVSNCIFKWGQVHKFKPNLDLLHKLTQSMHGLQEVDGWCGVWNFTTGIFFCIHWLAANFNHSVHSSPGPFPIKIYAEWFIHRSHKEVKASILNTEI